MRAQRPRAYEQFRAKRGETFPQVWKVTARFVVLTSRGQLRCVRMHAFPSDQVVHIDEATLAAKFRSIDP